MSRPLRLPTGGLIDRPTAGSLPFRRAVSTRLRRRYARVRSHGNGVKLVGRSFKYHRPRGIFTAGPEEPNALVTLRNGARREPNTKATRSSSMIGSMRRARIAGRRSASTFSRSIS